MHLRSVSPSRLLFFGMFILPLLMLFIDIKLWNDSGNWEISASPYFLPTEVKIQNKSTNLLIFNDTGEEEHVMLICFLHHSESS